MTGEYERHVTGNLNETIDGWFNQHVGHKKVISDGTAIKLTYGLTDETTLGVKQSNFVGGQININIALKAEANISVAKTFNLMKLDDTVVSRSWTATSVSECLLKLDNTKMIMKNNPTVLAKEQLGVYKGALGLWDRDIAIFK